MHTAFRGHAFGRTDEFAENASVWPADLSRRRFIQLMGASLALVGVENLTGCNRQPRKEIVPYVTPPEAGLDLEKLFYASAFSFEGFARGILVEAHAGRPTKIEGNPSHPDSLGASDVFMQASVLSLYDPDRSRAPTRLGIPSSWRAFEDEWSQQRRALIATHGRGAALLTEPSTSPTFLAQVHAWLDAFPEARWYQHSALPRYDRNGQQLDYNFADADVILAIDGDVLSQHPSALRYHRAFASRRKIRDGHASPNRIYAMESSFTLLGSMADARLPIGPTRLPVLLNRLAANLQTRAPISREGLSIAEAKFLQALSEDIIRSGAKVMCVVGARADESIDAWANAFHAARGAYGVTVNTLPAVRSDPDPRASGGLSELSKAIDAKAVDTLVVIETNAAYSAPADLDFENKLRRLPRSIHLGQHADETAAACKWHLPQSHPLETWSDLRSFDGTVSIVQPLIEPMYATRSDSEVLRTLIGIGNVDSYTLVRDVARGKLPPEDFERSWRQWLDRGMIANTASPRGTTPRADLKFPPLEEGSNGSVSLQFAPDPSVGDGRWANNAWLQELPRPFTHLVWDNAALICSALAQRLGVENGQGLRLRTTAGAIEAPALICPGQADKVVTLSLGYGRSRAGTVGDRVGVNGYAIRSSEALWTAPLLECGKTAGRHPLVTTHGHFSMEGRDLARVVEARSLSQVRPEADQNESLYPDTKYKGYAWAMAIDLSSCTGCNACVIACQAENNIPSVGKDQVSRGREMHWIRIDRYYVGPDENPRALHQPVPCMHCEHAPCELVCPVGATVHSSEGLNDMVYNRCVGTRYCSNNCPYKVRHFNFLDYREPTGSTVYLQKNPNVTVRERGVMEKCTYCVQRINAARITAEKENRRIRDGEIQTACQQACPADAIVFGDLADPQSRVNQLKKEPTHYALLAELQTKPRTTYLARIVNAPEDRA